MSAQGPAAIALFLYRRPDHTRRVVDALRANALACATDLYVFCDGARFDRDVEAVARVGQLARTIDGFRRVTIVESAGNQGLARAIRAGVTEVLRVHARAIVVEDDVVLSSAALDYFNAMLERFDREPRVSAIAGFTYPPHVLRIPRAYPYDVFVTPRLKSWGWATWRDRWDEVDWSAPHADRVLTGRGARAFAAGGDDLPRLLDLELRGRTDSWAIRWDYHQFRQGRVCVHPRRSYAARIDDGEGTHGGATDPSPEVRSLNVSVEWRIPPDLVPDPAILRAYKSVYDRVSPSSAARKLRPSYVRRAIERRWHKAIDPA